MIRYFPGIPDGEFVRGDIPMTKQEVRMVALAKARISPEDIIIDVGAGTGSLSIEAACQAPRGQVFAIEREREGIELINQNAVKFQVSNLETIHGLAPAAMADLPAANVIIIGGTGGHLRSVLTKADDNLQPGGRLITMAVTVETLHTTLDWARTAGGYQVEACGLQVNRLRPVGSSHMFEAFNQVYIIACTKAESQ